VLLLLLLLLVLVAGMLVLVVEVVRAGLARRGRRCATSHF
jgi:hypothetical protein